MDTAANRTAPSVLIILAHTVVCDHYFQFISNLLLPATLFQQNAEFNLNYLSIAHDLWVARFFCDRIAVMNQGRIVELGSTDAIFENPQHPYTQTLLQAAPLLTHL
jgi:peptide/nickel transport system ATP-binding protein